MNEHDQGQCRDPSCLFLPRGAKTCALLSSSGGHDEADDEAVEAQGLCKDEDEDHAHEQAWLLSIGAHACIANDANGESSRKGTQANGEARTQVGIARVGGVLVSVNV